MNAPSPVRTRLDEALAQIPRAYGLLIDGSLRGQAAERSGLG